MYYTINNRVVSRVQPPPSFLQAQAVRFRVCLHRFRRPPIQGLADITHARGGMVGEPRGRRGVCAAARSRDDNPLRKPVGKLFLKNRQRGG